MREWLLTPVLGIWISCIPMGGDPLDDIAYGELASAPQASSHGAHSLRKALHNAIDDHDRLSYAATWPVIEDADEHPSRPGSVLDIYRNRAYPKSGHTKYHREHTWPKSYGFPKGRADNSPFTDCHALFAADASYNISRHNRPYRDCDGPCQRKPVDNAGIAANLAFPNGWEVWKGRRGDVARALFYMDLRYEGGTHGDTLTAEPNLVLTDDMSKVQSGKQNEKVAYMGSLSTLLVWHWEDPVTEAERDRNDIVEMGQGNRNPFVDYPDWVDCIYLDYCD